MFLVVFVEDISLHNALVKPYRSSLSGVRLLRDIPKMLSLSQEILPLIFDA